MIGMYDVSISEACRNSITLTFHSGHPDNALKLPTKVPSSLQIVLLYFGRNFYEKDINI